MSTKQLLIYMIFIAYIQMQIQIVMATPVELNTSGNITQNYQNTSNFAGFAHTVDLQNCLVDTASYQLPGDLMIQPLSRDDFFLPLSCNMTYEGIAWFSEKSGHTNALIVMYISKCGLFNNYSSPALAVLEQQMSFFFNCSGSKVRDVTIPYPGVIAYCASNAIIEYCGIVDNSTLMLFMSKDDIKTTGQILKNLSIVSKKEDNGVLNRNRIRENYTIINFTKLPGIFMYAGPNLPTGSVKFFNRVKKFGFIAGDDGKDYPVYTSGLMPGVSIEEGDYVIFDVVEGEKGPKADRVMIYYH